ncbi:MAG: hypothetical protein KDC87_22100 [Planctomycetes bacterium]|nr:hypothetical protein [Planctomycetota bacterium]MCB9869778.1 hypothetical protein [Planctomycetota bacterium]
MIYLVGVVAFLLAFAVVYAVFPYLAGLLAVVLALAVPVGLCLWAHQGWEVPAWAAEKLPQEPFTRSLPDWQRLGVVALVAGAYVGVLNRHLCVYFQAQQAESKVERLEREVRRLAADLATVQSRNPADAA